MGIPPHKLNLFNGAVCTLIRNLNVKEGREINAMICRCARGTRSDAEAINQVRRKRQKNRQDRKILAACRRYFRNLRKY